MELARASRVNTMGEMAAAMAHELGQPLSSAVNFLSGCQLRLADGDYDTRDVREAISQALYYTEQAGDIIKHVRQFVRLHEPNTVLCDIHQIIRDMVRFMDAERRLLFDNEGCLKCRKVFVPHRSANCPDGFPNGANYKTLTQSFVDHIKSRMNKKSVAAIMQPANDPTASSSTAPIAAIMGSSSSAVAYMPSNTFNVLEDDTGDSDDTVSLLPTASAPNCVAASMLKACDDTAPISIPHFFWRCTVGGAKNSFPITISALLDHGSHIVLISSDLDDELGLKRRTLPEPMPVELAVPDKKSKRTIELSEYVKL